ncbi:glycosyltransferase family 2 protein [Carboxylicivirga linearis]|uniref:Glycosyltransferase n=1 Tax=Carboxylicivirga linearis TaxID=1628157 RepID=A0ABS5JVP3_9BACT|nr:glycosyltransferase family 2 protein [Carboxylicivirga linearis]MBS2098544.1 glycosyltransferase [Carboxylicivirga linearis]
MHPKISIVTPSYNQGQFIEQTIDSILSQNYPNLEYLIIDGGSTDNSVEIIKKYTKHLTYWSSEPDKGQSDAINKGFNRCSGLIINWINSDDFLLPGSLSFIAENFKFEKYHAFASSVQNVDAEGHFLHITDNKNLSAKNLLRWRNNISFHQPGIWLRNDLVKRCGQLPVNFNHSFDLIYLAHYFSIFPKIKYSDTSTIAFRLHETSKSVSQKEAFNEDLDRFMNNPIYSGLSKHIKNRMLDQEWDRIRSKISNKGALRINWPEIVKFFLYYPQTSWDRKSFSFLFKTIMKKSI